MLPNAHAQVFAHVAFTFADSAENFEMAELMESNPLVLVDNVRKKKSKKGKIEEVEEPMRPGIVYVGRIPHGFYEKEMEGFFSQFGEVKRIKVSRNKKVWIK